MRKRKKSEEGGFNVWRSYSDMMAGVLLLFILIMCVTLFQAQKSYNESIKERDDKIALQEQYTAEILAQQSELDEKDSKLSSQDEQLDKQKKLLAELAALMKKHLFLPHSRRKLIISLVSRQMLLKHCRRSFPKTM